MQEGYKIASLRLNKGITQTQMARLLKIGLATYQNYESSTTIIKLKYLDFLSTFFNVPIDYLLGLSKSPHYQQKIANKIDYSYLKFFLKHLRVRKRLKLDDLENKYKITRNTILNYEKKFSGNIIIYLISIAKEYNISIDYMCGKSLKKNIK